MIELEEDKKLYVPGKVYIYKSLLNTNDNFRDTKILKMENYDYNTKDDNIQAILFINNVDPTGTSNTPISDDLFDRTKEVIKQLKEKNEINKSTNNIIRFDTNKPVFSDHILSLINNMKDCNITILGIYISNFKNFEPVECGNGISTPISFKENSVLVIKKKMKELAIELDLPIISKFRFRTGYMTLDTKSIVVI